MSYVFSIEKCSVSVSLECIFSYRNCAEVYAMNVESDQSPRSMASDLGQRCFMGPRN